MMMKPNLIQWSKPRQRNLESQLIGYWQRDEWRFSDCPFQDGCEAYKGKTIYFVCQSSQLKAEIKYACWQKLEQREWRTKTLWSKASDIKLIGEWLNSTGLKLSSLVERDLTSLITSFRTYLVNCGLSIEHTQTQLDGNQKIREYSWFYELNTLRQIYKILSDFYDDREEYDKEIWDVRKLGYKGSPAKSSYTLNFKVIPQPWLLYAAKSFIRYTLATQTLSECQSKLAAIKRFSKFLQEFYPDLQPFDLNRSIILDHITRLPSDEMKDTSKHNHLVRLRTFLEICGREQWAGFPEKRLIYREDLPRISKSLPRFIPDDVLEQLNNNLDGLPGYVRRMVLIIQEVGMRISELCRMPFDCLSQDSQGDFILRYYQYKMKREHCVPISREIAAVIQEQQRITKEKYCHHAFLFPSKVQGYRGEPIKQNAFSRAINVLAVERKICDQSGKIWRFQAHQFRHTVGTRMINLGVPQHIIQRYLGHESPEMTSVYAHIHDKTLKEEFGKFKSKIVDVAGNIIIPRDTPIESTEFQWFKKNVLAQALPNGSCALPVVAGECPHANACMTCAHFRTDSRFLDEHKKQLEQTQRFLETAQANGWTRQAEMNQRIKTNLENIIASLEENSDETAT